jgi:hypothetical protein
LITDRNGAVISEQPVVDTANEQYSVTGVLAPEEVAKLRTAM